jgi:anti-anti-sigma factor
MRAAVTRLREQITRAIRLHLAATVDDPQVRDRSPRVGDVPDAGQPREGSGAATTASRPPGARFRSPGGEVTIRAQYWRQIVVLVVGGVLDLTNSSRVDAAITAVLRDEPTILVIDLDATTFLDSVMMVVLAGARCVAGARTALRVVAAGGSAAGRMLRRLRVDLILPIFPTLEHALTGDA